MSVSRPQTGAPIRFPLKGKGRSWPGLAVLLAAATLYLGQVWYYQSYVNDDSYITFRYSRNLALGRGPYFNPDEHVEGYTNFSLMLIVAAVVGLLGPGAAAPAAKGLGAVGGLVAVLMAYVLVRQLRRRDGPAAAADGLWAGTAAGLIAVCPGFALNCVSGLETGLFAALLTAGAVLGMREIERRRWQGSGAAFAAAVLTRPEGPLLFAGFWLTAAAVEMIAYRNSSRHPAGMTVAGWFRRPLVRALLLNLGIVVAVFAAHLVFRRAFYDGEWLPNTYYAKAGGFAKMEAAAYVYRGIVVPLFNFAGTALGLAGLAVGFRHAKKYGPVAVMALAGSLLPFLTGTDWMPGQRLLMPYLPLAAVIAVTGWAALAERVLGRRAGIAAAAVILLLPLAWTLQARDRAAYHREVTIRAEGYQNGHQALAEWIQDRARPGDAVALMDIGQIGYILIDQRIIDITGLTDRTIAKSPGPFLAKQYDPNYIIERYPEFIVLAFHTPRDVRDPGAAGMQITFWTEMEKQLYRHPDFLKYYITFNPPRDPADRFPIQLGAVKVFQHDHPDLYYYLAVFRYNTPR